MYAVEIEGREGQLVISKDLEEVRTNAPTLADLLEAMTPKENFLLESRDERLLTIRSELYEWNKRIPHGEASNIPEALVEIRDRIRYSKWIENLYCIFDTAAGQADIKIRELDDLRAA